jgi:cytochrome c oxidase assembly protein subunit 11
MSARAKSTQVDTSRTITVEFDANARGPLGFAGAQPRSASGRADDDRLRRDQRAGPVGAGDSELRAEAGDEFFKKIECFCFTQQTLAANESRKMPVVFVIDPKLPKDVKTITLSYTFFEVRRPRRRRRRARARSRARRSRRMTTETGR